MTEEEFIAAEDIIERGHQSFMEVGAALTRIHDEHGYRLRGFGSFQAYLRVRWSMGRAHGYRLMQAAAVAAELSPIGDTSGLREYHLREIAQLPTEERQAVVEELARQHLPTRGLRRVIATRRTDRVRDSTRVMLASATPPTVDPDTFAVEVVDCAELPAYRVGTDLIVTSPPYGIGLEGSDADDSLDWNNYCVRAQDWANRLYEAVNPEHGRICINVPLDRSKGSREPVYADWLDMLRNANFEYEATIVWKEGNTSNHQARGSVASPNAPHAVAPVEMILVMYRGTWNRGEPQRGSDIAELDWINWLSTTWQFAGEHRYRVGHMAPFPEELARRCILLYSFPGDLVGDPFVGSGTTAVAALKLGRRFRGSDIDPECVELTRARVAREVVA